VAWAPTKIIEKRMTRNLDQSGAIAIVIAVVLVALCGFVALAVDVGHLVVVEAELQRAADAGALSGAINLAPYTGSYPDLTPDWLKGQIAAVNTVNDINNKADNQQFCIANGDVLAGYWLLNPQGLSQALPQSLPAATYLPEPAIRVTLTRTVTRLFAPIIGKNAVQTVTAAATAILPEGSGITGAFAMAVEKTKVLNPITNVINLAPLSFGYGDYAQWYNRDGTNSVTAIRRNDRLQANDSIYIPPGAKDTLYSLIKIGQTIMVPVVESRTQPAPPSLIDGEWYPIKMFVPFSVTGVNATGKSISGNFVNKCISPDAAPSNTAGTYSGISGTPKLIGP
jgi:hypothetical protein